MTHKSPHKNSMFEYAKPIPFSARMNDVQQAIDNIGLLINRPNVKYPKQLDYLRLSLDYYRMNGRTPDTITALKRAVEKCEAVRED